jgi:hypothetical protein
MKEVRKKGTKNAEEYGITRLVVHHCIPHLSDAVASSIKLLPSSDTTVDIYCFMHYVKLVMIAQQPHHRWENGENWRRTFYIECGTEVT